VFSAVSKEVDRLFPAGKSAVARFEPDGAALVVVGFDQPVAGVVVGSRWELDDSMAATAVYRAGRAARMDDVDWSAVEAPIAVAARQIGPVSTVAGPSMVEGRLWGVVIVTAGEPLPVDTGERLEKFTELVATAIANAEAREELQRLADEQAALRRVATLVATRRPARRSSTRSRRASARCSRPRRSGCSGTRAATAWWRRRAGAGTLRCSRSGCATR